MADITAIRLKIEAVELVLASFTKFRNEEEKERVSYLESKLETVSFLEVYFDFSKAELKDTLNKLQEKEIILLDLQRGKFVDVNNSCLCDCMSYSRCCSGGLYLKCTLSVA